MRYFHVGIIKALLIICALFFVQVNSILAQKDAFKMPNRSRKNPIRGYNPKNFHALIIGINKYKHWPKLRTASNDAKELADVLQKIYRFTDVKILLNEEATREKILEAIDSYLSLGKKDSLLIYYAGHGWMDKNTKSGYWVPYDAREKKKFDYIANSQIVQDYYKKYKVKHLMVIADSCFSGTLLRGNTEREAAWTATKSFYKPSRWIMTSGGLAPVSDGAGEHSPFATRLLQYLKRPDKEYFGIQDVYYYIRNNLSNQRPIAQPLICDNHQPGGEFIFRRITLDFGMRAKAFTQIGKPEALDKTGSISLLCKINGDLFIDNVKNGLVKVGYRYPLSSIPIGEHTLKIISQDKKQIWQENIIITENQKLVIEAGFRGENKNIQVKSEKESFNEFLLKAMEGDASSQLWLANAYLNGNGVAKNEKLAFKFFEKAAIQEIAEAQFRLGRSYHFGIGVEKNYNQSVKWYKKAIKNGSTFALSNLGICYEFGLGLKRNPVKAFNLYKQSSSLGNLWGMNNFARCYEFGIGTKKNEYEAFILYKKAVNTNKPSPKTLINLARFYFYGKIIPRDINKAIQLYKLAAENGNIKAQMILGGIYDGFDKSCPKNDIESIKWYTKAANQNDGFSQYQLYKSFMKKGDMKKALKWLRAGAKNHYPAMYTLGLYYEGGMQGIQTNAIEAVKLYKKAAQLGCIDAQARIGQCYKNGVGVKQDYKQAVLWYRKAAEQENGFAQDQMGYCYEKGIGVKQDIKTALKWYHFAAENGFALSQSYLGVCYENGLGVKKDPKRAIQWYRKAAKQGFQLAQYSLGICYQFGTGTKKNPQQAVQWYRKAAEQGYANAQNILGLCYRDGFGVKKDPKKAVQWYRKSAEQGNTYGQYNLGLCYQYGKGVDKDEKKAVEWYRKAAEQGNSNAQYSLGGCYDIEVGVKQDPQQAVQWYRKAAEQGNSDAQNILGLCYRDGFGVKKDLKKAVQWYRKAAEQRHAYAQYNLAWYYVENNIKLNKAEKWSKQSLKNNPNNKHFLDTLGWIYYKQGKYSKAEMEFKKALNLCDKEKELELILSIKEHLAEVYIKHEDKEKARKELEFIQNNSKDKKQLTKIKKILNNIK